MKESQHDKEDFETLIKYWSNIRDNAKRHLYVAYESSDNSISFWAYEVSVANARINELQEKLNILEAPTIYVPKIVLCKDCKHRDPEDHKCDCGAYERQGCIFKVSDDYYCAYGELK